MKKEDQITLDWKHLSALTDWILQDPTANHVNVPTLVAALCAEQRLDPFTEKIVLRAAAQDRAMSAAQSMMVFLARGREDLFARVSEALRRQRSKRALEILRDILMNKEGEQWRWPRERILEMLKGLRRRSDELRWNEFPEVSVPLTLES